MLRPLSRRLVAKWSVPLFAATVLACAVSASRAEPSTPGDPTQTDGDKYKVPLENSLVRVLAYHDRPGDRTHLHRHPCFVLYAIEPFKRRLTFPDGTQKERAFHAGDVAFMAEQAHVGENVGTAPTNALLVELKGPCVTR